MCVGGAIASLLVYPAFVLGQASDGGPGVDNPVFVPELNVNDEYTLPTVDGTAAQCMKTDGSGVVTWEACAAGGGAPTDATYITQTANGTLTNEQALSALSTGMLKVTTSTGVLSTGIAGTDYLVTELDPRVTTHESTYTHTDIATNTAARHAAVTLAGKDYLTLSTQQVTANSIDLTDDVAGALPLANGGTGQTTAQLAMNALSAVAGATNEHVLTKDTATGNAVYKAAAGGFADPMTTRGDIIYKDSGGTTTRLAAGTATHVLTSDGTDIGWAAAAGGGGVSIGDAVGSGTSGSVLFVDSSTQLAQDNANLFWDDSNNRLGVGTATPNQQLELTGNLRLEAVTDASTNGVIYKGTSRFLHTFTPTSGQGGNLFLGEGAGNFSMIYDGYLWHSSHNVGIGDGTLEDLTTGYKNFAAGYDALANAQTTVTSVAVGDSSLYNCTEGNNNFALGSASLYTLTDQDDNVAIGTSAGYRLDGSDNVAIGSLALRNSAGSTHKNTYIGTLAGYGVVGSAQSNNTGIGYNALKLNATGNSNIAIGYAAADNMVSADNGIWIGYNIDAQSTTADDQMSIGNLLFSEGITGTGTTVSTGGLGVGVTSPDTRLDVDGAITQRELSADPSDPDEGSSVCWQSDGTGTGDDGDIVCKITAGGTTKTTTLIDFSAL